MQVRAGHAAEDPGASLPHDPVQLAQLRRTLQLHDVRGRTLKRPGENREREEIENDVPSKVPFANLGGGARAAADLPINENMNQSSPPPVSFADIMTVLYCQHESEIKTPNMSRCSSGQFVR